MLPEFTDIHCHLLPGIDDGARTLEEALEMARMAVEDGIGTIICTPHQLGNYRQNGGTAVRRAVDKLQSYLQQQAIPLQILPGGDVRIDEDLVEGVRTGEVLSLGDHGKHVLLELPHELYFPIQPLLEQLSRHGVVGILSHPERNHGILKNPAVLGPLVDAGCLMQVTAGSLCGTFGAESKRLAEQMLADGLIHFLASDGHGSRFRRPILRRAFERASELAGRETAEELCQSNPRLVAEGLDVPAGRRRSQSRRRGWFPRLQRAA